MAIAATPIGHDLRRVLRCRDCDVQADELMSIGPTIVPLCLACTRRVRDAATSAIGETLHRRRTGDWPAMPDTNEDPK